jgi:hypothetical protein
MTRPGAVAAAGMGVATTLVLVSLVAEGDDGAVEIELYVGSLALVGAAVAVILAIRLLPLDRRPPTSLLTSPDPRPEPAPTKAEIRWQGYVAAGTTNARAAEYRLRPALRRLADGRLRARHGISVDHEDAAGLMGPAAWSVLRQDQPLEPEVDRPGLSIDAVEATTTALENL